MLQAYQKRAVFVAEALRELAVSLNRRIPVRLVKGAYWDSEIKHAQVIGLDGYPVFTRKEYTDLSYLACAVELLKSPQHLYPQFATHNALTVATIMELAGGQPYEFQRLHGMGESLHDQLVGDRRVRIYAPVGAHKDLLAYLIRRLLENGANTSFVHLLLDQATPIEQLTQSPIALAEALDAAPNEEIPLPRHLYGPSRLNSFGIDFGYRAQREPFLANVAMELGKQVAQPQQTNDVAAVVQSAQKAWKSWDVTPAPARAAILKKAADLLEKRHAQFIALCISEGKKTYVDGIAEVRAKLN